jgi:hypothetical protein
MSDWIFEVAPEIYGYIEDLTSPGTEISSLSQEVQELVIKKNMHSGYFHKCNFAGAAEIVWKDDVKFMIPFLILTWLRQLQQFFDKCQKRTWSNYGNYNPHLKLNQGEGSDPLAVVYLSMPVRVSHTRLNTSQTFSQMKHTTRTRRTKINQLSSLRLRNEHATTETTSATLTGTSNQHR